MLGLRQHVALRSAGARSGSSWPAPCWPPADLTGALLLAVGTGAGVAAAISPELSAPERFLWVLIAGGLALLLVPEVAYLRDAFDGSALFRMNTVFKAGYQAFLLLALAAACALPWAAVWLPRRIWQGWAAVAAVLLLLGLVYPYGASYARTNGFAGPPTLDGLRWLRVRSPGDPGAMAWMRANTPGDAVVLEAFGDDYSAFGHARISTFTGRPTVMGWAGHELQWAHNVGTRPADIKTMYTTPNAAVARRRCSTATACATSWSGRSSRRPTGPAARPSGTSWAGGCIRAGARPSGSCRVRATSSC